MSNDFVDSRALSISESGKDEAWLQNQICDYPIKLNLGDLRLVAKEKVISSGGRLDILLQDSDEEKMYEVEVQLGETDPSHIIRTIEYWDFIRKKYPQREHYAVLIAETITKRFFNVIGLLSANIPIIAIQCQIIEIENKKSLVFTTILNSYEEPEEISQEAPVDEKYWQTTNPKMLEIGKYLYEKTKDIYQNSTLELNKWSIVIKKDTYNQIKLNKRSGDAIMIEMKYGKNKESMQQILESISIFPKEKYKQLRFDIRINDVREKIEVIQKIAELNNEWWKYEGDA